MTVRLLTLLHPLRMGRGGQLCEEELFGVVENPLQARLDRLLGRILEFQRIHVLLIAIQLEVQVSARAPARGADVADDLPLLHVHSPAYPRRQSLQMGVARGIDGVVLHFDHSAVAALSPSGVENLAPRDRPDRSPPFSAEVHAVVGTIHLENRVKAGVGKLRADAGELQRKAQERPRQRSAVEIVITALALFLLEINGKELLTGVDQLGGQDAEGGLIFLALARPLLVDKLKGIPSLNVLMEVDLPGKDIGQLRHEARLEPDPGSVLGQGGLYHPGCSFELHIRGFLPLAEDNSPAALFPGEGPVFVELDLQSLERLLSFRCAWRWQPFFEVEIQLLARAEHFHGMMFLDSPA